jgi:hypothetical protein
MTDNKNDLIIVGFTILILSNLFFLFIYFNADIKAEKLTEEIFHKNYLINQCENKTTLLEEEIKENELMYQKKILGMSAINYAPTFEEIKKVLDNYQDRTKYHYDDYNCVDYSQNLIKEFKDNKIYSCLTTLYFEGDDGHALVSVDTSDKGIIYIEPQDEVFIYSLEVGDNYCDKVDWYCTDKSEWKIKHLKNCFLK